MIGRGWYRRASRTGALRVASAAVLGMALSGAPTDPIVAQSAGGAEPERTPDAARGLELFAARCAECHGDLGRGMGPLAEGLPVVPASFAAPETVRRTSPRDAYDLVTDGRIENGMPPWRDALSATERWDAVAGAWSFALTADRLARGRLVWEGACASCHVPGEGDVTVTAGPDASPWPPPDLVARSGDGLYAALRASSEVHAELAGLDDETIWLALDYGRAMWFEPLPYASLSPGGRLRGQVANGTEGSQGVAGAIVRIVPFSGTVPGTTVTATLGAGGAYEVDDLLAGADLSYRAIATYQGVDYVFPEPIVLDSAAPVRDDVDFVVYEPSTELPVAARSAHLVLEPVPERGVVAVTEMWALANDTDRVRVDDGEGTARFRLPTGAHALSVDDARVRARATIEEGTLVDHVSIPPGGRDVVFRYDLPYRGRGLAFERPMDLPAAELRLLVTAPGASIRAPGFPPSSVATFGEATFAVTAAEDLAADAVLAVEVTGLPAADPPPGAAPDVVVPYRAPAIGTEALALLAVIVAGVGVGFALLAPGWAGRTGDPSDAYARVVQAIADLDERHERGEVAPARYAEQRAALIDRALALARFDERGA